MINNNIQIENKVHQLISILDRDTENMRQNIQRLVELKELVIKRQEDALSKLLEQIKGEVNLTYQNDTQRDAVRAELAELLGINPQDVTLTSLMKLLPQHWGSRLKQKQDELIKLSYELKSEHFKTAMLLKDMSRLNRMMLNNVLKNAKTEDAVTYDSAGDTKKQSNAVFMNMKL